MSLKSVVRPAVCIAAVRAGRFARWCPTHISWLRLHRESPSRPRRHAKDRRPRPAEEWTRAAGAWRRGAGRFRSHLTGPIPAVDGVRLVWVADRNGLERHRAARSLRLVCGGHVRVVIRRRSEYWRSTTACQQPVLSDRHDRHLALHFADGDGQAQTRLTTKQCGSRRRTCGRPPATRSIGA